MIYFKESIIIFLIGYLNICSCEKSTAITFITPEQVKDIDGSVEFNCTVQNEKDYGVVWNKKYRERPNDATVLSYQDKLVMKEPRFSLTVDNKTNTYSFKIKNIERSDTGIYECQLIVSADNKITSQVELLVRTPPTINDTSTTVSTIVTEKQPAELICSADGYPRPTITWRREHNAILPNGGHSLNGNSLKIKSTHKEDRGTYYCSADNGIGQAAIKHVNLEIEFAPVIAVPRPKIGQAIDYDTELVCKITAYPPPAVVWIKNGVQLASGDEYEISQYATAEELTVSTLKIVSLETEKFGDYFCKANNKMGHAEARINVFESKVADINFPGIIWSSSTSTRTEITLMTLVLILLTIF